MPHHSVPTPTRDAEPEPQRLRGRALRLVPCGGDGTEPAEEHGRAGEGDSLGGCRANPGEELWRQVGELADVVRLVQEELVREEAPRVPAGGPAGPAAVGAFAALFDGGEETEDALTEALAFSDLYELLVVPGGPETIRRTGHPEAGTVLEVAARVLPDHRLAREARKSALKARTHLLVGG